METGAGSVSMETWMDFFPLKLLSFVTNCQFGQGTEENE